MLSEQRLHGMISTHRAAKVFAGALLSHVFKAVPVNPFSESLASKLWKYSHVRDARTGA